MSSLSELLRGTRRRRFVGRDQEIALFWAALAEPERATVLFVHGLGGVGKSWLLDELAETAGTADVTVLRVDVRLVGPTPEAVLIAIREAAGGDPLTSGLRGASGHPRRTVLLIDSYDLLQSDAEDRLRAELASSLPASSVTVVAGRTPPSSQWLADPAWREVLTTIRLGPLSYREADTYLAAERVPAEARRRLVELSDRHPLAMSLLAEAWTRDTCRAVGSPTLADFPGVVRELLERVVHPLDSPLHQASLEACAHMRYTTECRLRSALEPDAEAHRLFGWLRALPYIEEGALGLQPHPLVRSIVDADHRWRDIDGYSALHHRVRGRAVEGVRRASDIEEARRSIEDAIFAARWHHDAGRFRSCSQHEPAHDELRPSDHPAVLDMALRHLGCEQTELVEHWIQHRPDMFRVVRDATGSAAGFGCLLDLHDVPAEVLDRDEGARRMWHEVARNRPPRTGEDVLAWRFLVERDRCLDANSALVPLVAAWRIERGLRRRCAWELVGFIDEVDPWLPLMHHLGFGEMAGAAYAVDGRRYAVFGRDWRRTSLDEWLERTAERELGGRALPPPEAIVDDALSEAQFADAVRHALRDFHVRERLAGNPLLRTRIVRETTGAGSPVSAVQELLRSAADVLKAEPRSQGFYRCVDKAFLRPAKSHERAAAELGVPYNTYRRHRDRGVARMAGWLWEYEIGGERLAIRTDSP